MRKITFTQDFATKKSGESWECDGQLASQLVNEEKVAEYADEAKVADEIEIEVTEETLELNPELVQEGVKVGETITVAAEEPVIEESPIEEEKPKKASKK